MAKISHDNTSWRASGLTKRYEEKSDVPKRSPAKKADSKRWCKGKVGREHKLVVCRPQYFSDPYNCWNGLVLACRKRDCQRYHHMELSYRCANCGKYVDDMAEEVQAIVKPKVAEMLALEAKWCRKGHLWD